MKILITFFSRTKNTKKVAEILKKEFKADIEEIKDTKINRMGVKGYLISGREGMTEKLAEIKQTKKDSSKYDLVIIGTPVWGFNMASPIRTYLTQNKNKFKKIAVFCTHDGGPGKTLAKMTSLIEKRAVAVLDINRKFLNEKKEQEKLKEFIQKIKNVK